MTTSASTSKRAVTTIVGQDTTGRVSKFTGTNSIGDLVIFELNNNIGIGTTNPKSPLQIVDEGNIGLVFNALNTGVFGTSNGTAIYGLSSSSSGNGVVGEANKGSSAFSVWGKATRASESWASIAVAPAAVRPFEAILSRRFASE